MLKQYFWVVLFFLSGCSGVNLTSWHFPYTMEVSQGNYITSNQIQQLQVGMTKDQVVFIIGYPLSEYLFDKKRWDFVYQEHLNDKLKKDYRLSLIFDDMMLLKQINNYR